MRDSIDDAPQPTEVSLRIESTFDFFRKRVAEASGKLDVICKGLAKLVIVDISLNRDQDNPQLIFESLNSTGLELSQADLIRNFILMGLEPGLQTKLYEHFWRPMEVAFGQEAYATQFDSFMRHHLTVKTGDIANVREVYEAFKRYAHSPSVGSVDSLVADIRAFGTYYCAMALGAEEDADLKIVFHDLRELKVDVAYPFLMELYHDYVEGRLSKDDLLEATRLVESYILRRSVCNLPSNSHAKIFANFTKSINKERYLEGVKATFLLLPSRGRFPTNDEFMRDLKTRDLYTFRNRSYWLRRLENYGRKERVIVEEYTIEHIMPQNELSIVWQQELGPEWEHIHKTYLHTVGNLTLTAYNSEYGDKPFSQKRDMAGGFRESPLHLNDGLALLERWDENAIRKRAARLANLALHIWAMPTLDPAVLKTYQPPKVSTGYTIDDHPHLAVGHIRELFDEFRKQVLQLDESVTEEFLKLYVAYKAETNFFDVIPQAKRLVLSLNIPYPEISDPRGICRDMTNQGRWGNGDVHAYLQWSEEMPYILGLVRQALERQLSDGNE